MSRPQRQFMKYRRLGVQGPETRKTKTPELPQTLHGFGVPLKGSIRATIRDL